ncbi:MAG: ADP-ribosylation factor GTPase activating protein, ER-Golgi transport [Chrysothrix sp. TS-e1954]|nr:MAG: ADP-ribosylation factor GTPase activating protein, ER-Golgi transport [Chrysothrix sp. TS-e1954]
MGVHISFVRSTNLDVWQWDQLRIMKVGGNESATKYFQTHGGSAALASKDAKTKYTSNAASKYKEELSRRTTADAAKYPGEVVVTDVVDVAESNGTNTPAGDDSDFFSSWDKPTIKRPSNPPSRTGTPSQAGRSSPFLNANANGNATSRPKSPLVGTDADSSSSAAPKAIPSSAVRKPASTGPVTKKPNILGAKKTKLGAKKVSAVEDLDFDAAEKKARDEAERIQKLGYDPDAEAAVETVKTPASAAPSIASPTPISPKSGFGATKPKDGNAADVERLGMGMGRLGFGQMASSKPAASAAPKAMGFGSVGRGVKADESEQTARNKFGAQKGISSDEYFGRNAHDPNAQAEAKSRLQGFEGATSISSNAYFGRPEDDGAPEDYGDLEGAAKDFVRKFGITAGDDLENVTALLGEGATRLHGAIRNYLNS